MASPEKRNPAGGPGDVQSSFTFDRADSTAHRGRPLPGTVRELVLEALVSGRTLTSLEAWREFGTSRLAADVHALRRMGWRIVSVETPVECREGRSARVATYRMGGAA